MRILLVHNYLRPPSGENTVFEQEKALLESKGHEVLVYARANEEIARWSLKDKLSLPLNLVWSRASYRQIREIIRGFRPEVTHFHNIFPLISPAAYRACRDMGIPVVQTLHHFRLVCPGAFLFRNRRICEACSALNPIPGVLHGCYRNSRVMTAGIASMIYLHHVIKTWKNCIDTHIVLSDFAKRKFEQLNFPASRFVIKPNFLGDPVRPSSQDMGYAIFIGRLGEEKGLDCLLKALRRCPEIHVKIIGDGPSRDSVLNMIREYQLNSVDVVGLRSHAECMEYLKKARFMVFPSIWYEGMPMAILEAMSAAKPAISSRIGVLPEMIDDGVSGLLFTPNSVSELTDKLHWMSAHPAEAAVMGRKARECFERSYTAEINYKLLMNIYQTTVESYRH